MTTKSKSIHSLVSKTTTQPTPNPVLARRRSLQVAPVEAPVVVKQPVAKPAKPVVKQLTVDETLRDEGFALLGTNLYFQQVGPITYLAYINTDPGTKSKTGMSMKIASLEKRQELPDGTVAYLDLYKKIKK